LMCTTAHGLAVMTRSTAVQKGLSLVGQSLVRQLLKVMADTQRWGQCVGYYLLQPLVLSHPLILGGPQIDTRERRLLLHRIWRLPMYPCVTKEAALRGEGESRVTDEGRLINPHRALIHKTQRYTHVRSVRGSYEYHHCGHGGVADIGWGGCYRAVMTIVSWYTRQGYTTQAVPSHSDIQRVLRAREPAHRQLAIGSTTWLGCVEGSCALEWLVGKEKDDDDKSVLLFIQDATDLGSYSQQIRQHFVAQGTPILVGVGSLTLILVATATDTHTGESSYLVVDPQYAGPDHHDDAATLTASECVAWRSAEWLGEIAGGRFMCLALPQMIRDQQGRAII